MNDHKSSFYVYTKMATKLNSEVQVLIGFQHVEFLLHI